MGVTPRLTATVLASVALASPLAAQTSERIVAFGDSVTVGLGDDTGEGGYPPRLAALLTTSSRTVVVENRGVSGETTAEGLSRLASIQGGPGDSIILMEGVNDLFREISNETIVANLLAMAKRARSNGFDKVHLATTTPLGSTPFGAMHFETIFLAEDIRELAFSNSLSMAEVHQAFYDLPGGFVPYYAFDAIHPDGAGYDELAVIMADHIEGIDSVTPAFNYVVPRPRSSGVPSDTLIQVVLFDLATGVDMSAATLLVNSVPLETTVSGVPERAVLQSQLNGRTGEIEIGLDVRDRASPPNQRLRTILIFDAVANARLTGDIDRDGRVDGADLVSLAIAFGAKKGTNRYDSRADFDSNGIVDGVDLAQLAVNFGRSK